MPQPATPLCLLIADDLTGACDAAVHFAVRGYRTVVSLDPKPESCPAEVLAISTESRNAPGASGADHRFSWSANGGADHRFSWSANSPYSRARILFKKIDSTLRGNVGPEIALAAEAFACDAVLISPALPAMGRTVTGGFLRVSRADFAPIDMPAYWRGQGLSPCFHIPPSRIPAAIEEGLRFLSIEAATDSDLDMIAAVGLASTHRILWVGSAGLASALARALPERPRQEPPPEAHGPALFCIGSDHPVTLEQQRKLAAARPIAEIDAESAEPESILASLRRGRHIALRIPYGRISPHSLRRLIGEARAPLVVTGGDTASLVCRALGIHEIVLHSEIAPGIPRGLIAGGLYDGVPVVTKSGAFGKPDALIQVADTFACPQ